MKTSTPAALPISSQRLPRQEQEVPQTSAAEGDSQAPALQRGLAILEHLAGCPAGATQSEISAALGLSPATTFRLIGVLEDAGYVSREGGRRLVLTRKLLLLSQPRVSGRSLAESCLPAMREALQQTGETVQLCCLAGDECVMIEQLASLHPFKYIVDLGSRPPVHCCAPGKALLAWLPEDELEALLSRIALPAHTPRTITDREALREELAQVRRQGYAVDDGEHFEGIHCVAAPVLDHRGHAVGAITIAGPSSRIQSARFAELGLIMQQTAQAAAARFNH